MYLLERCEQQVPFKSIEIQFEFLQVEVTFLFMKTNKKERMNEIDERNEPVHKLIRAVVFPARAERMTD